MQRNKPDESATLAELLAAFSLAPDRRGAVDSMMRAGAAVSAIGRQG